MTLPAALGMVFVLGLATAVSPCPMATNIAAISFLGRTVGDGRRALLSAGLYVAGRTLVYVVLGAGLLWAYQSVGSGQGGLGLFASSAMRRVQLYGNMALGPAMVLVGMILLGLISLHFNIDVAGTRLQGRAARGGALWALPLGMLFALAFCPPSVIWFLGALALSAEHDSMILPPIVYGIGTAVPVIGFALLITFGGRLVGKAFNAISRVERWFRLTTGTVFIVAGVYYILRYIYRVI